MLVLVLCSSEGEQKSNLGACKLTQSSKLGIVDTTFVLKFGSRETCVREDVCVCCRCC